MPLVRRRITPAMMEANRRNSQQSTGPRTELGKATSARNAFRSGINSKAYKQLWSTLVNAPLQEDVDQTAAAVLTPAQARHPLFRGVVEVFREVGQGMSAEHRTAELNRKKRQLEALAKRAADEAKCSAEPAAAGPGASRLKLVTTSAAKNTLSNKAGK